MTNRYSFNGLGMSLGNLSRLQMGRRVQFSAENFSSGLLDQREPHVPFGKLPALE